jgi:ribosomal protein S18 acetylase RimI-like enzyme
MEQSALIIRNARPSEFAAIGQMLVRAYSQLAGFPSEREQPAYYNMLANVGDLTKQPSTELIVAVTRNESIAGAVVYFGDMKFYGSGGTATHEKNSAGFRLLGVESSMRGKGIGKALTLECINRARARGLKQVIIHTTKAMQQAWEMYESFGFERAPQFDFMQGQLPVFGFRLML